MKRLCVIGDPVEHSKSPVIQTAMIRAAGLDMSYDAQWVTAGYTKAWLEYAKREGWAGFNATMPHKQALVKLVDELSDDAARIGAVNTVCIREGKAYGHNTDGAGFLRALRLAGMDPQDRCVLVLGAGGAAKAVVYALLRAGARKVVVANRTVKHAGALCSQLGIPGAMACGFSRETLYRWAAQSQLLINCTSLGMTGTDSQFEDLSFLDGLPRETGVFDLIYSPARTALLERAEQLGLNTANGLDMLIWQGVYALELFADKRLDETALAAEARKALEGML